MKLFYCCYGGAHTSVTCASIHLHYLPENRIPEFAEFRSVPFYDKMDNCKLGTPVYVGTDEMGWDIYIIGMKHAKQLVIPAVKSYLNACGVDQTDFLLANALVELHPITSVGGVLTRRLGIVSIGRPMTVWGIRRSYRRLVRLVRRVKKNLKARQEISDFS